jgi:hypothetical protein
MFGIACETDRMKRLVLLVLACSAIIGVSPIFSQEDSPGSSETPFYLPTPAGWRTETLAFPLEFAPLLFDRGLEELRFAPGMFEQGGEDFWTYAFVWWLPAGSEIEANRLAVNLETYFSGLARAVAKDKGLAVDDAVFEVEMTAVEGGATPWDFEGRAEILDAFVTTETVELSIRAKFVLCVSQHHGALLFELSPQSLDHDVWRTLGEIRDGFRCDR